MVVKDSQEYYAVAKILGGDQDIVLLSHVCTIVDSYSGGELESKNDADCIYMHFDQCYNNS